MKFNYPGGSRPLDGYTIKRGIGRGGFGEVYYATSDAGKEVALKLVRRNLDIELRGVTQCLNLKHANLLALYDIRRDDEGDTWIVMEYVSGESLEDAIAAHPQGLPVEQALAWMHGLCAGVEYLHDRGIVHRDLKPGNVFSDEGVVKIGDYGLSKFISASRRSGQTESVGTVHYMAPEVANGRYGKEIDIYALGVMLYEVLTGQVPFDGESVGEVLMKHLTAQPDLSRLLEPYRSVVARALEKDPARRIASAGELLAGLPRPQDAVQLPPVWEAARRPAETPTAAYVQAAPVIEATLVEDRDPVWQAMEENWRELREWWAARDLQPWQRALIWIVLVFGLLMSSGVWIPIVVLGVLAYAVYRVVRRFLISAGMRPSTSPRWLASLLWGGALATRVPEKSSPQQGPARPVSAQAASQPVAEAAARRQRAASDRLRQRRQRWSAVVQTPPAEVAGGTPRALLTELLGSLLLSAGIVAAVSALLLIVLGYLQPFWFAWLSLTSLSASWLILAAAKTWESGRVDTIQRRGMLLLIGVVVGTVGYGVHALLSIDLPHVATVEISKRSADLEMANHLRYSLFDGRGAPTVSAFLAYFGLLFPLLRWWRLADPRRDGRWSFWSTACYGGWAFLLSLFWLFPSTWGVLVALTTATSVQLASPWLPRRKRLKGGA